MVAWTGSGSWRASDCLPFSTGGGATQRSTQRSLSAAYTRPAAAAAFRQPDCLGEADSVSEQSASPPLRTILGEGFNMLKTRSEDYGRGSVGIACEFRFTGGAAAGGGPLHQARLESREMAAILSAGSTPTARYISPFLGVPAWGAAQPEGSHLSREAGMGPAPLPPPPLPQGELAFFEGTNRRGKPRALVAMTAAAVAPPPGSKEGYGRRFISLDAAEQWRSTAGAGSSTHFGGPATTLVSSRRGGASL